MRKIIKVCCVFCFVLLLICSLINIFSTSSIKTNAQELSDQESDLSSFLNFEQAIIDLNNKPQPITDSQTITSSLVNEKEELSISNEQISEFTLKRLIVQGQVNESYGATNKISYNNLSVLCYNSEQETKYAYEQLSKNTSLDVSIDKIQALEQYAENDDYDYTSYKNWGAEAIDIGGYRQFLLNNSVTKEVVVVVFDTGINTSHSMFTNRLLKTNGKIRGFSYYDSTYTYSKSKLYFDVDNPNTPDLNEADTNKYSFEDDHSHGTHVAGIICDLTPSNVKILPVKIGNSKGYSTSSIMLSAHIRVVEVYSKQYNVVATNLSFSGGGKSSESERDTYNQQCYQPLLDLNIIPVTAAGNEYDQIDIENLDAVVVSALTKNSVNYEFDHSYSNYGKIIDICAPGSYIYSAIIAESNGSSSEYGYKQGTSMASPQVAGVVALLYLDPRLPNNFTARDIVQSLYDLSLDMGEPGKDIYYGHGMLNLKYFESKLSSETISFYKNGVEITEYKEVFSFDEKFDLSIKCSNPQYTIIYQYDKIPTYANSNVYVTPISVSHFINLYVMGVKLEGNKIIGRTSIYRVSFFNKNTPLEDCLDIDSSGSLIDYTGYYEELIIPTVFKGKKVLGVGTSTFKRSNLVSIKLPDTLETIGGYAFQYCNNLEYVYAPGVTKIYIAGFDNCPALPKVSDKTPTSSDTTGAYFPNLTDVISFTFNKCENIESVELSKLKNLGTDSNDGYDFQLCTNLKSVHLPNITSIPEGLFNLCQSLMGNFEIGKNVAKVGTRAFYGCNITSFSIHEENSNHFFTDGKGLYYKNSLIAFASGNKNIDYEIKTLFDTYTITEISELAMVLTELNELTIPSTITKINKWAFSGSNINKLYYNATNCTSSGYYEQYENGEWGIGVPFEVTDTIIIGENVKKVPTRLFKSSKFNNLIINSFSTQFDDQCFYREVEIGAFNSLTLNFISNFTDEDWVDYFDLLVRGISNYGTGVFNSGIKFLKSKTEVPVEEINYTIINNLNYHEFDGEYHIYSNGYKINAYSNEFGNISPTGESVVGAGKDIKYTFVPNENCYLKYIYVDGILLTDDEVALAQTNGYTFSNVNNNHTIEAVFSIFTYTISSSSDENGTITPLGKTEVNHGDDKTYTITPDTGYIIKDVKVNGVSIGAVEEYTFEEVISDQTIHAEFEKIKLNVEITNTKGGIVTPNQSLYYYGDTVRISIQPNSDYEIYNICIDGETYPAESEIVLSDLIKDATIHIEFIKLYTINTSSGGHGTITPTFQVREGSTAKIEFFPDNGYIIKSIYVNGQSIDVDDTSCYEIENINRSYAISVEYEIKVYSVNISLEGQGTYSCESDLEDVTHGKSIKLKINVEDGWYIKSVIVNGAESILIDGSVFIYDISEDIEVSVIFKEKPLPFWEKINMTLVLIIGVSIISGMIVVAIIIKIVKKRRQKQEILDIKERTRVNFYQEFPYLSSNKNNTSTDNYYRRLDDKNNKK